MAYGPGRVKSLAAVVITQQ